MKVSMSWLERLALPVEKLVGGMDPDLLVSNGRTLRRTIGKSTVDSTFDSLPVLGFAIIALVLAAAGLYAMLAYLVAQQTSQIGIRLALGAEPKQVLRKILFNRLRPALLELVLGLAGSAAAVRLIQSMLYETDPIDPVVFAAVATTLLAQAMLARAAPAWRASRPDPMQALRTE
jgi:ABC-type antimicrobial peptide transport system permease subunit